MELETFDFGLFQEPDDFRPKAPPPSEHTYHRSSGDVIRVNLVGNHSLWAHVLWNAGRFFADYIDSHPDIVCGKSVLELGCGAALPSMVSALRGSNCVVTTDYPEKDLIDILCKNVERNVGNKNIYVVPYLWGSDVQPLLKCNNESKFDVIVMCDLVFNHSQHHSILRTCLNTMKKNGVAFCAFSHHRPWLARKDLEFLRLASEAPYNFRVEKILTQYMEVMFESDPGDEEVRKQVHLYQLSFIN